VCLNDVIEMSESLTF